MTKSGEKPLQESTNINLFNKLLRKTSFFAEIVGANILKPNYRVMSAFPVVFLTNLLTLAYIHNIIFTGMPLNEIMEGLTLLILGLQGMTKLYANITHRDLINSLYNRMRILHETNVDHKRNRQSLLLCAQHCLICYKVFMMLYFGVIICYDLLPLFIYYYTNERVLIIPVHVPGFNLDSNFGFMMNILPQLTYMTFGATGLLAADMSFLILVLHTTVLVSHFKYVFDDLNEMLEDFPTRNDSIKLRNMLKVAWTHHIGIIKYIVDLNEIYSIASLFELATCASVLTLSLFLIVWEKWIVGPFLITAGLFQLLEYCILGTVVQIQNEKIANIIYNSTWYKLGTTEQKQILLMLMRAQNPSDLSAGEFAKLNVQTCMQVLKTTYSYLMMIMEFFN